MKTAVISLLVLIFATSAFAYIELTEEQFENAGILSQEIRKKNHDFIGFNGTRQKMEVIGISDEEAKKLISKINLEQAIEQNPKKLKRAAAIQKLKSIGLTEDELENLGIKPISRGRER